MSTTLFREQFELIQEVAEHEQHKILERNATHFEISSLWIVVGGLLESIDITILVDAIRSVTSTIRRLSVGDALNLLSTADRLGAFEQLLQLAWTWIAFGIFHPNSEAKFDHLSFSGSPLEPDDVAVFKTVISTPHPGRLLWVLEHGDLPQGKGLEKIAYLLVNGLREPIALGFEELEVALQLETWVCVVIPGCGFGWVSSASIVSRSDVPSKCSTSSEHVRAQFSNEPPLAGANVRAFSRHWSRAGFNQVINRNLGGAQLHVDATQLTKTNLDEILDACPNLWHLNLMSNEFESIKPLIGRRGHDRTLSQFAELLERPCSRPLRYVAVNRVIEALEPWEKLERALKDNQTLRLLYVNRAEQKCHNLLSNMRAAILGVTGSKVPPSNKIAFLSVINAHSKRSVTGESNSSLGRLDSNLTATIFAFAGIPITRTILW